MCDVEPQVRPESIGEHHEQGRRQGGGPPQRRGGQRRRGQRGPIASRHRDQQEQECHSSSPSIPRAPLSTEGGSATAQAAQDGREQPGNHEASNARAGSCGAGASARGTRSSPEAHRGLGDHNPHDAAGNTCVQGSPQSLASPAGAGPAIHGGAANSLPGGPCGASPGVHARDAWRSGSWRNVRR